MNGLAARFAVCELVLRQGSFAADVASTRAVGVQAIGVTADWVDTVGAEEARRILDGEGVVISSYMGAGIILQPDGGQASLDDTARRLETAAMLGAPAALVITGALGDRDVHQADAICREWLAGAAALAARFGVPITLEPIHPLLRNLSYVHTFEHALALVDGIDGVGIAFDVGHLWWERDIEELVRRHVDAIVSVQLTNVDRAALAEARYERAPLADGDVPVASLVQLLEAAGYRGWYEDEVLVRSRRDQRVDLARASREWFEAL